MPKMTLKEAQTKLNGWRNSLAYQTGILMGFASTDNYVVPSDQMPLDSLVEELLEAVRVVEREQAATIARKAILKASVEARKGINVTKAMNPEEALTYLKNLIR